MNGEPEKKTLAIVGLGLIGASIAEATRKRYPDWNIIGVSSPSTIKEALNLKLIDEGFEGYENAGKALEKSNISFLCTPIDHILGMLKIWEKDPPKLKPNTIISDVGSTKAEICALGGKAFSPESGGIFIGSHPMAGSEKTGLKTRDGHLFENAAWIITVEIERIEPTVDSWMFLKKFVEGLGARVSLMPPDVHDQVVAVASHLPQLISTALAKLLIEVGVDEGMAKVYQVAGSGLRDMTRLAASSFSVWEPILRTNQSNLKSYLKVFSKVLGDLEEQLPMNMGQDFFVSANKLREMFSVSRKGFSSPTTEILVDLEDKPGELLAALKPLSDAGINILDLEILKVREGEEGVLMMGFRKPEEAQTALDLLAKSGHKARLR